VFGPIWCIGGIFVTTISYWAAFERGGLYLLAYILSYGAIVFGAVQFFVGLINNSRYTDDDIIAVNKQIPKDLNIEDSFDFDYGLPESLMQFCSKCKHYDRNNGICSQIHENVKSYPQKFNKKCAGKHFVVITKS